MRQHPSAPSDSVVFLFLHELTALDLFVELILVGAKLTLVFVIIYFDAINLDTRIQIVLQ